MSKQEKPTGMVDKVVTALAVLLCIILAPILIFNCTLAIKGYINADEVPTAAGWLPMIVQSGSMEPVIMTGDMILCQTIDPSEVLVGDVISFYDPADSSRTAVTTHRVIGLTGESASPAFLTKGDNNNTEDTTPVPASEVIGIYRFRLPGFGNVAIFMQTTTGMVVCVVLPILLLVGLDVFLSRRKDRSNRAEADALRAELEALRAQQAARDAEQSGQE